MWWLFGTIRQSVLLALWAYSTYYLIKIIYEVSHKQFAKFYDTASAITKLEEWGYFLKTAGVYAFVTIWGGGGYFGLLLAFGEIIEPKTNKALISIFVPSGEFGIYEIISEAFFIALMPVYAAFQQVRRERAK